ncbi:MAG: tetratricopeptide repeat protein [Bacteroidia bacterium]
METIKHPSLISPKGRRIFVTFLLLFLPFLWKGSGIGVAQNKKIDSLLTLIKNDKEDTNKVKHLYTLCKKYNEISEYDKGLTYGKRALALAQSLSFKKVESASYLSLGNIYSNQGNCPEALKNYFSCLKIMEEIKNKQGISASHLGIGNIYFNQGNNPEALKNYFAALKIREEIKDKQGYAGSYVNIGLIYLKQGNYSEALKYLFAGLKIFEEFKDKYGISYSYQGIGNIYDMQGNYPEALKNYFSSLKIKEEIRDKDGVAASYNNIGALYTKLHKTKEAQDYLNKGLALSKEIGSKEDIKESYAGLAKLDSAMGNYKAAFEHHKLFIIYRDSLNNEETQKKTIQSQMTYDFEKKEAVTKAQHDAETKQQKIITWSVGAGFLLVLVFAGYVYRSLRIAKKQKQLIDKAYKELREKHEEIQASIRYAKRIQNAMLTPLRYINDSLNRLMGGNKPKE